MQSAAVDFKYELGTCLHEGDREAEYETSYDGRPATVKFIRPETSLEQAKLLQEFAHSANHDGSVQDFGEAHIFDTDVIFVLTANEPQAPVVSAVPLYRRHARLAIGGAIAAGALCLLLLRSAEHKAPPPVPAPVLVQQAPLSTADTQALTPPTAAKAHGHRKPRRRHK